MNKAFVSWFCGVISTDGHVGAYYLKDSRSGRKYKGGNVTIFTAEPDWAKRMLAILENQGLSCHVLQCHQERFSPNSGKVEMRIDIHHYNPPRKRTGINQWQVLVDAIDAYGATEWIMKRKLETLRQIA